MSESKRRTFFYKLCNFNHFMGFPNFWTGELEEKKVVRFLQRVGDVIILGFFISEICACYTQPNLSDKQEKDLYLFICLHFAFGIYFVATEFYKERFRKGIYYITVVLGDKVQNLELEDKMVRRSIIFSACIYGTVYFTMGLYIAEGVNALLHGKTYQTVIAAWPDVNDYSTYANLGRVAGNFCWWLIQTKGLLCYVTLGCMIVALKYQYIHLQNHFERLNEIFENPALTQEAKERKYEEEFEKGIQIHIDTLRFKKVIESVSHPAMGGQIFVTFTCFVINMIQFVNSDHSQFKDTASIVSTMLTILIITGQLMWGAGDITVEAALLPTAMFHSGWHNCQKQSARRVRTMVFLAIFQAQQPVIIELFGFLKVSHESYLAMVKATYSVFSVVY